MKGTRITMAKMRELYPSEYLFLTDCIDDGTDITEGIVVAHSPIIEDINKISRKFKENTAVWYTGRLFPEGSYIL